MPGPLWKLSRAKPVDLKKLCKSVPACLMFKKLWIQSMTVTSYNQVNDMRKSSCWIDTVNCGRGVVMKTITIGSDCSGLGTDCVAVERLGLKFVNMFSSDTDVHCRDVLEWFLVSIDWVISIGNKIKFTRMQTQSISNNILGLDALVNDINWDQRHPPKLLLPDAASKGKTYVDVYTCGFPCQPFRTLSLS